MKSIEINSDFEVQSLDKNPVNEISPVQKWWYNLKYAVAGIVFGIVLVKAEKELQVKANTGGNVKYKGSPAIKEIKTRTGGSVTKI